MQTIKIITNASKFSNWVDHLREKFASVVVPETFLSVAEQVVPFKGASGLKRYLPKKK